MAPHPLDGPGDTREIESMTGPGSAKVPQWITDQIEKCRCVMGLGHLRVRIEMVDCIKANGEYIEGYMGLCAASLTEDLVYISLRRDIQEDAEGRLTIVHEMMHAATMLLNSMVRLHIIEWLPPKDRDRATSLYGDVLENFVQHHSFHLARVIDKFELRPLADRHAPYITPIARPNPAEGEDGTEQTAQEATTHG